MVQVQKKRKYFLLFSCSMSAQDKYMHKMHTNLHALYIIYI